MASSSKADQIDLLLGVIAVHASERGSLLTKTRLVKFLYLLDLYWAQSEKVTFTGWPWAFVHYGPYCRESTDAIDRAEKFGYLSANSYESKFRDEDYRLYGPGHRLDEGHRDSVRGMLPIYVWSNLFRAVGNWCDDTFGLLDFVYFRTGPMRNAMPGDVLSFDDEDKIDYRQFQPVKMEPLSKAKKAVLRGVIDKIKADMAGRPERPSVYDREYFDFLSALEEEETPVGLSGVAKVKFDRTTDD